MDEKQEIDSLADEISRFGALTFLFVCVFVIVFFAFAAPPLLDLLRKFPIILEEARRTSSTATYAAYAGIGGIVAAFVGLFAAFSGPIVMLLLGRFLRSRTHYVFCKRATTFLFFYKPTRPMLLEKVLRLLEAESVRNSFR